MPGMYDSTLIRVTRSLKSELEGVGLRLRDWSNENPERAPDYLDNADHVPINEVILHLLRHWQRKKARVKSSRRNRARRRQQSTPLVVGVESIRPDSGDTPMV